MLRLVRPIGRHADVGRLFVGQPGQLHADLLQVKPRDLLVQLLGQPVNAHLVLTLVLPKVQLGEGLVGEGIGHHERRVARGATQVHQAPLGQQVHHVPIREDVLVVLWLHVDALDARVAGELLHLDLVVEVPDVAHDGLGLHLLHVLDADHVAVAGRGDVDVGEAQRVLHGRHLVTLHGRLQGADGVDLGHDDPSSHALKRLRAALAHVAVAAHDGHLAGDHDVGRPLDAVDERLAAPIQVVEFGLGHRVVHVDGGHQKLALLEHLVKAVHAGGRFLRNAAPFLDDVMPEARLGLEGLLKQVEDDLHLLVVGLLVQELGVVLGLEAPVDEQGRVAAVIHDLHGALAAREGEHPLGAPPIFLERLALPGEHRDARRRDAGRRVVLGREDVAAGPANVRAQARQGLDQHGRLDRHVKRPGDADSLQGLLGRVFPAHGHQARHLLLGDLDLLSAPIGLADILHLEVTHGHPPIFLKESLVGVVMICVFSAPGGRTPPGRFSRGTSPLPPRPTPPASTKSGYRPA